jgi:hypothetical protein
MFTQLKAQSKRRIGSGLSRELLEKLTEYSIAENEPSVSLAAAKHHRPAGTGWAQLIERGREVLWSETLAVIGKPLLLLEFGSWQGESMRYLAGLDASPESRFFGFDSFEGLPEDWRGMSADRFDVGGRIPHIDDKRVTFVKGWFRDSVPPRLDELEELAKDRSLLIHFDADLYSSTLFLLFTLGARFKHFHFIFDEFSGHETRALFNFMQATGAEATFKHRLDWEGWPQVVSGELIIPGSETQG